MFTRLFADGSLVAILVYSASVGVYWIATRRPRLKELIPYVLMAGLTSLVVAKLMSLLPVQTVRPFIEQGVQAGAAFIDNPGFPSDHALLAAVVVIALYVVTPYKRTSYVLMALTVVMCVARILALVHTPVDILGGIGAALVGTLWYVKHKHDTITAS